MKLISTLPYTNDMVLHGSLWSGSTYWARHYRGLRAYFSRNLLSPGTHEKFPCLFNRAVAETHSIGCTTMIPATSRSRTATEPVSHSH